MIIPQEVLDNLTDRPLSVVHYIVVHHTADNDMDQDIAEIAAEERATMGFSTVGYHAVIHKDGKVQFGRPIGKVPAANTSVNAPNPAKRSMNTQSYAISLEGNFHPSDKNYTGEKPTPEQLHALIQLIEMVKGKLPNAHTLLGHRDIARICNDPEDATACPGDLLYAQLPQIRKATHLLGA